MNARAIRRFPEPEAMRRGIEGVCKWGCGRPVLKPAIYWHRECFDEYCLFTRSEVQKRFLIERDGARCADCGDVPLKWLAGQVMTMSVNPDHQLYWGTPEEQAEWRDRLWTRPEGRWIDLTPEERATGEQQDIRRVCALEVDHRVPLWSVAHLPDDERRRYFGPENLWLLCPRDHKAKSKREAAERAEARRAA